jgi:transposase
VFRLSPGNAHDAPEGRELLDEIVCESGCYIVMDKAYEGDDTRRKAMEQGFVPVVPPKNNRRAPWEYDIELYKRRNEIERYFLRLKRFRRVFTRYDKLDIIYTGVILCAMMLDAVLM